MTVERLEISVEPGETITEYSLALDVRSTQAAALPISLPVESVLLSAKRGEKELVIELKDGRLELPLMFGASSFAVKWQEPSQHSFLSKTSKVSIPGTYTNASVNYSIPRDKWVLGAFGAGWVPVFFAWGQLLAGLVIAFLLGKQKVAGMGVVQWFLLSLGLLVVHPVIAVLPVVWLLLLELRGRGRPENPKLFQLLQVAVITSTAIGLVTLYYIVATGLVGSPDMSISGMGCNAYSLRWYIDRGESVLPQPTIVSLPLTVWRVFMFAWALWLVSAIVRWLGWGWKCFSLGGHWPSSKVSTATK